MTKEVLISLKGLQLSPEDETDAVEVISVGEYFFKNGKHYLLYDEMMEGCQELTKTIIKIGPDTMEVTRKGPVSVHMMYERNKKNITYYNTPVGSLLIGIEASKMDLVEEENLIQASVSYSLEVNYEHVANCDIEVKVSPRSGTN